ncbi:hypothetical protein HY487_01625 [Candidatus Woesearchaeota archaeon]|nr:hypothetical protein [Candidatus Woesearchaeota archaeon]
MKKLTAKATAYLILAVVGLAFAIYSIKAKNYILLVIAIIFALISVDNIFCNLRKTDKKPV